MTGKMEFLDGKVTLLPGDCVEGLASLPSASVDSVVTDPPYGLEFMGKEWDGADGFRRSLNAADAGRDSVFGRTSKKAPEYRTTGTGSKGTPGGNLFQEWCEMWARECLRVLKPGGYMLAFGGTRTQHRMVCAIEDAGFEIRDQIGWIYAQGFPKNDSSLKPAWEPVCVARKPLMGTVVANMEAHGTGRLNIDECRIGEGSRAHGRDGEASASKRYTTAGGTNFAATPGPRGGDPAGRYPANIIHDGSEEVVAAFPDAPGQQQAVGPEHGAKKTVNCYGDFGPREQFNPRGDSGSAARFYYAAKADADDRLGSKHPTVKPVDLMQYLVRLVTPRDGVVLDPFGGTGTTGEAAWREGRRAILIEREEEYQADIARRMELASQPTKRAAVAKTKNNLVEPNALPLFLGLGGSKPS